MLTVGSLFSGIGGMDIGLERAGMQVKWQCEKDPWCRKILAKHWPTVPKYDDITTLQPETVEYIDLLAGGFPCQDLSVAGKRAGLREGTRSGLWSEFARLIRALRPRYVLVENVPGLLANHALGRVLGDLVESGYDAEWDCLSAYLFGRPHIRERIWIVAYPTGQPRTFSIFNRDRQEIERWHYREEEWGKDWIKHQVGASLNRGVEIECLPQSRLVGKHDGIPDLLDRLRGLGNAVIPAIVQFIGERIMEVRHAQIRL